MCQELKVQPLVLAACYICAGVPSVMVRDEQTRKPLPRNHQFNGLTIWLDAFVFCSECGAQTGELTAAVGSHEELAALVDKAHEAWNTRDTRNQDLYAAAVASGRIMPPVGADGWILTEFEKPPYNTPVDVVCMGHVQDIAHKLVQAGSEDLWIICSDDDVLEELSLAEISHWRHRPVFIPAIGATA
jgi:hypothetical protein